MLKPAQIKIIHVAKKTLCLSDEDYRGELGKLGVQSSKQLSPGQFDSLMTRFVELGFKSTGAYNGAGKQRIKDHILGKIDAILDELGLPRKYADAIAKNRFGVDSVAWCDTRTMQKILAMLVYHQCRKAGHPIQSRAKTRKQKGSVCYDEC